MNLAETHQPILLDIIRRTDGPILELGAGDYSTRQIHEVAGQRKILTIDHDRIWLRKYSHLKTYFHKFILVNNKDIKGYYLKDNDHWSVVFIDNIHWDFRVPAIMRYKDTADYLVIHDTQFAANTGNWGKEIRPVIWNDWGERDFSDTFKYWIEFMPANWIADYPTTVLGSNKHDLGDIEVKDMIIINRNK